MVTERRELQGERLSRISSLKRQVQTRVSRCSDGVPLSNALVRMTCLVDLTPHYLECRLLGEVLRRLVSNVHNVSD